MQYDEAPDKITCSIIIMNSPEWKRVRQMFPQDCGVCGGGFHEVNTPLQQTELFSHEILTI